VSRVHCLDCGMSVVVDPNGVCPEGHIVGAAGARVASAIGSDIPFPDEPEPWVSRVDLGDEPAAEPVVRTVRPVSAPGFAARAEEPEAPGDSEELLRELHSLSDLSDSRPTRPTLRSPAPTNRSTPPATGSPRPTELRPTSAERAPSAASPTPPAAVPAPAPTSSGSGPSRPSVPRGNGDALADLSALEAAVQALGIDQTPPPRPDGNGGRSADLQAHIEPEPLSTRPSPPDGRPASVAPIDLVDGSQPVARDEGAPAAPGSGDDDAISALDQLESLFSAPSAPNPLLAASRLDGVPAEPPQAGGDDAPQASIPPSGDAAVSRWEVLADVAELADSSPDAVTDAMDARLPDPATHGQPEHGDEPKATSLDLSGFTARGRRVGRREAAKRRRRGKR